MVGETSRLHSSSSRLHVFPQEECDENDGSPIDDSQQPLLIRVARFVVQFAHGRSGTSQPAWPQNRPATKRWCVCGGCTIRWRIASRSDAALFQISSASLLIC